MQSSKFPFYSILILLLIFYLAVVSRSAFAPLLPIIEVEFGLTHGEAGSLFLFAAFGQCVGLLGSGFVASRLSHRQTILLSAMMLGVVMVAISRSTSVFTIRTELVLVGFSLGLYFPSGVATMTHLISQEHWGKALAVHEMPPNLAFLTAPLLVETLLRFTTWRGIVGGLGISAILIGILFLLFARVGTQKGESPNPEAMQKILHNSYFWVMAALFALTVGAESGVYAMLPLFLVHELAFERKVANTLVGFSRVPGFLVLFISGVITDRLGHERAAVLFLGVVGVLTMMLGIFNGPLITPLLIVLQAASLACFFPAALAITSLIFPSHLRSLGVSMVLLSGVFFGVGAIPPGIGYLAEISSFSLGFFLLGLLILGMVIVLYRLRVEPSVHPQNKRP